MLDKNRILSKLDELDMYLNELESIMPASYKEYVSFIEKRRACERLLHIFAHFDRMHYRHMQFDSERFKVRLTNLRRGFI